jgi:hypothetical protein
MTSWRDNIYSGAPALTSAQSSLSPAELHRTIRFSGGSNTQTIVLPTYVENFDAKLYIITNGSAATTDKITVSAAGTTLVTFSSFGSANGILRQTTTGLGVVTPVVSAMVTPTTTTEVTAAITLLTTDTAAQYQVDISFNRVRLNTIGAP